MSLPLSKVRSLPTMENLARSLRTSEHRARRIVEDIISRHGVYFALDRVRCEDEGERDPGVWQ